MTEIGTIIDGKYEILKEVGRGGMSVVYLATDTHLNKNWAVKEIKKKGSGKNDEIIVNSLLAEANLMKRLDHASLPRIVDIIDNGITIYVVMDFIEGESLDKVLNEHGAQPEELVISWAKQICDALSYLHSQKPPIIYRDMKPANVMLKDDGNIKIIDFGIAREYKEQNLADTTVLGTKGYAPPEQYSGQTDARSDIFALGMTMHHLLTGVDPRNGEAYASVRQWVPELSEGIEAIIDKCVEPAAENRYQNCSDLLYDLEHPDLVTKGYKKKQKKKLFTFIASAGLSIVMALAGIFLNLTATSLNNKDYDSNINSSSIDKYYAAVELYPERIEAYQKIVQYNQENVTSNKNITTAGNTIEDNYESLDNSNPDVAALYYEVGKLYFAYYDGSLKERSFNAKNFFEHAISEGSADFERKEMAECYFEICSFMTKQSTTKEPTHKEYEELFKEIDSAITTVDKATDDESNYDKISLYYTTMLLLNDQSEYLAGVGFDRQEILDLLKELYQKSNAITSNLTYVNELKTKINSSYEQFKVNINTKYNEVEKRQQNAKNGG